MCAELARSEVIVLDNFCCVAFLCGTALAIVLQIESSIRTTKSFCSLLLVRLAAVAVLQVDTDLF